MTQPQSLMTIVEAARYLSVSVSFLQKLIKRGEGPPCVRLGARKGLRFQAAALEAWATSRAQA